MPQNSEFLQYRILNVHCKVNKCKETGKWDSQSTEKQTIKRDPQISPPLRLDIADNLKQIHSNQFK